MSSGKVVMKVSQGFLVKVLLSLVTVRIISFSRYLSEMSLVCQEQEQPLVNLFQRFLSQIEDSFVKPATTILGHIDYGKLDLDKTQQASCRGAERNLEHAIHAIEQLLLQTDVFPRGRPTGEVYDFVDSITPSDYRTAAHTTIVLWPMYNWGAEPDLQARIADVLELKATAGEQSNVVLYLAEVEASNPLYWAFLAHEIGHYLEKHFKLVEGVIDKASTAPIHLTGMGLPAGPFIRAWTAEFIADMIAIRLVGPAYLCALVSLAVTSGGVDSYYRTHPSWYKRAQMVIQTFLRTFRATTVDGMSDDGKVAYGQNWTEELSEKDIESLPDWVAGFWKLLENRREQEAPVVLAKWSELFSSIESIIDDKLGHVVLGYGAEILDECEQLYQILYQSIPIGSFIDKESLAGINARIRCLMNSESTKEDRLAELKSILKSYVERPTRSQAILNAGWKDNWMALLAWDEKFPQREMLIRDLGLAMDCKNDLFDLVREYWKLDCQRRETMLRKSIAASSIYGLLFSGFHGGKG